MKPQEKKLLMLLLALLGLLLLVKGVPWLVDYYRSGQQEIVLQKGRIERYIKLIEDTERWQEREALKRAETEEYKQWVFATDEQVATSVQRALRLVAEQAGINIQRTQVAELGVYGDWLMISQKISFTLEQQQLLKFLQALNESRPRLFVVDLEISNNRRQYIGEITVAAFSPVPD